LDVVTAGQRYLDGNRRNTEVLHALSLGGDPAGQDYFLLVRGVHEARSLAALPEILARVIREERWRRWRWAGREHTAPTLLTYLTGSLPHGIDAGGIPALLREVADHLERALEAPDRSAHRSGAPGSQGPDNA
jgi:hypothetical protein